MGYRPTAVQASGRLTPYLKLHYIVILDAINRVSTSYLVPHTSYLIPRTSYLVPHTSYFIPHTSYLIPHTSYLILHTSYLILHTSYLIPHTSYFIPHTLNLLPGMFQSAGDGIDQQQIFGEPFFGGPLGISGLIASPGLQILNL